MREQQAPRLFRNGRGALPECCQSVATRGGCDGLNIPRSQAPRVGAPCPRRLRQRFARAEVLGDVMLSGGTIRESHQNVLYLVVGLEDSSNLMLFVPRYVSCCI